MHYFVTGASGFIGKATVIDLLANGHTVTGLARSDTSAAALEKLGAKVVKGDLTDTSVIAEAARNSDGVAHLAFIHDFSNLERSLEVDRGVVTAIGDALAGTGKPFVAVSGTLSYPDTGKVSTEDSEVESAGPLAGRNASAELLFKIAKEKNVRGSLVRFSPTTHGGEGGEDHGFIPMLANFAKQNGFVTIVGDGSARWPAVHRADAASLVRLALEKGEAGATYHAVSEQGVAVKDTMGAVAKRLGLPVESKQQQEALPLVQFFAFIMGQDNPTSSTKTQQALGWKPKQLGIVEDIEKNYVFDGAGW